MLIILPPLVLTMGRACSAMRAVADGLQDLHSIRLMNHSAIHSHPVESRLCRRTRPRSCELTSSKLQEPLQRLVRLPRHPCER